MVFSRFNLCLVLFFVGALSACHLNIERCGDGCEEGFTCVETSSGAFCAKADTPLPTEIEFFRVRGIEPRTEAGVAVYPTLSSFVLEWNATGAEGCVLAFEADEPIEINVNGERSESEKFGRFTLSCTFDGSPQTRSLVTEDLFGTQRLSLNGVDVSLDNAEYLHAADQDLEFELDVGIPCVLDTPEGNNIEFDRSTSISNVVGGLYRVQCRDALALVERSVRVKTIFLDDILIEGESPRVFSNDGFDFETQVVFDLGTPENDEALENLRCSLGATLNGAPAQINGRRFVVGEDEGGVAVVTQTCADDAGLQQTRRASLGLVRIVSVDDAPPTAKVGENVEISLVQVGAGLCQLNGQPAQGGVFEHPATQNETVFIDCAVGNENLMIPIEIKVFALNALPSLEDGDGADLFRVAFTPLGGANAICSTSNGSPIDNVALVSGRNTLEVRCSDTGFEESVETFYLYLGSLSFGNSDVPDDDDASLGINETGLHIITGSLFIGDDGEKNPNDYVQNLREVGGGLDIRYTPDEVLSFPSLVETGFPNTNDGSNAALTMNTNPAVTTVMAPLLERGGVGFFSSDALTEIDMPNLVTSRGIRMSGLPLLRRANFPSLETIIANSVIVTDVPSLSVLEFPELVVSGALSISDFAETFVLTVPKLDQSGIYIADGENVEAHFSELTQASRIVFEGINGALDVSFPALERVTLSNPDATQGISFSDTSLESISFPQLELSREGFAFDANQSLTHIDAPKLVTLGRSDEVTSVRGLILTNNPSLIDVTLPSLHLVRKVAMVVNNVALCRSVIDALEEDAGVFPARASDDYDVRDNLPPAQCSDFEHDECITDAQCNLLAGFRCEDTTKFGRRCQRR